MFKLYRLFFLLSTLTLVGCASQPELWYKSKIKIKPADKKDQYYMNVDVLKMYYDEGEPIFTAPEMLIEKGKPARIESGQIVKMRCTVLVSEKDGHSEAKADVRILNRKTGETWKFTQSLLLDKKIESEAVLGEMEKEAEATEKKKEAEAGELKKEAAIKKIEKEAIVDKMEKKVNP